MAGEGGQNQFLVAEHRLGVDGVRHPAAAGHSAALSLGQFRLLRGADAGLHHQPEQYAARVARLPGDVIFIVGGIVPFMYIAWVAARSFFNGAPTTDEFTENPLYTEVTEEPEAQEAASRS